MHRQRRVNDSVHWYMSKLTSRIIARSGIPSDRFHLGKIILQSFKDAPDFVMQIDGGTNESETNYSALERTVRCATALRNIGLQRGDVMVLMAPNHIDLGITLYAALCLGVAVAPIDTELTVNELSGTFETIKPKIIFCQSKKAPDVQLALNSQVLDVQIITFDSVEYLRSFSKFMKTYADYTPVNDFIPTDFDPEETIAFLIATSGTTGLPKTAATSHKNLAISFPYLWSRSTTFPSPTRMALIFAQLQWLSAIMNFILSPILRYTRLQTSQALTKEHIYYLLNTYKPTFTIITPPTVILIKPSDRDQCDFTSLELIIVGGSAVSAEFVEEFKKVAINAEVLNVYGMTEITSIGLQPDLPAPGSCGKPAAGLQYRLIDLTTGEDITEPNTPGEMWVKGPGVFMGYYNNPKATEQVFADDRWLKTGDIFYRDENWNFFFVERLKLLLRYKINQIAPVEVEDVIRRHPGVLDVAVTGVPDPKYGDLVVACVVRRPGRTVTAQEIKDLVKEYLTDSKQLRGGVIFMNSLPTTASTKIHRKKLKELALQLDRE